MRVINSTRNVVLADRAESALSFPRRLVGLLGRSELGDGEGLWIAPCNSIHTWFMRFAIDAAFVDEEIKYAGYIDREAREIERLRELDELNLPKDLGFVKADGFSSEVQEKLLRVRPATLGQASRIPGITPVAIALLRVYAARPGGSIVA